MLIYAYYFFNSKCYCALTEKKNVCGSHFGSRTKGEIRKIQREKKGSKFDEWLIRTDHLSDRPSNNKRGRQVAEAYQSRSIRLFYPLKLDSEDR